MILCMFPLGAGWVPVKLGAREAGAEAANPRTEKPDSRGCYVTQACSRFNGVEFPGP